VLKVSRSDIEKWHALLFIAMRESESLLERSAEEFRKDGTRAAVLDGDRYGLWYVQGENELHWSFMDVPIGDAPNQATLPFAKWMAMVLLGATKSR
jgi:hypothetical protein